MRGIHVQDRVTTADIMRTKMRFDATILLRITYEHPGKPAKVEIVHSCGIPLVDKCAVYNAGNDWLLDKQEPVPTVRVAPIRLRRV